MNPPAPSLLLLCILLIPLSYLAAQTRDGERALPPTSPLLPQVVKGPDVTVADASNRSVTAKTLNGASQQVGLRASQIVDITVHYAAAKAGQQITAIPLDGGSVVGPDKKFVIGGDGTLRFRFQAGREPGFYQVALHEGAQEVGLQFWVLDEQRPEKNPPVLTPR